MGQQGRYGHIKIRNHLLPEALRILIQPRLGAFLEFKRPLLDSKSDFKVVGVEGEVEKGYGFQSRETFREDKETARLERVFQVREMHNVGKLQWFRALSLYGGLTG